MWEWWVIVLVILASPVILAIALAMLIFALVVIALLILFVVILVMLPFKVWKEVNKRNKSKAEYDQMMKDLNVKQNKK